VPDPRRLLVAAQPLLGGVPNHVVSVVRGLPKDRFEVDVACPRNASTWLELEGLPGVTLHEIRPDRHPAPADSVSLAKLVRLARAADVIHVHSAKAGFLGRLAAAVRRKRASCAFTPHGWSFWAADGAEARLYLELERAAARWCAAIVALSDFERQAGFTARIGKEAQYRVIRNGVDLARFDVARRAGSQNVVFIGRLDPPKRPDLALRAFARLSARFPDAELQVVGDGRLAGESRRLADRLCLGDRVRFLGPRDDVPELLGSAACVLLASDYESAPFAVVEGMAAGLPVVATDVAGVGELVKNGRTGFLAPAGDADALAAGVERVLDDSELARRLGEAGRQASKELSLTKMVDALVTLYDELAAAGRDSIPRSRD
jgi:glycosyltransferase involved in cell wall biosynthesis